MKKHFLKFKNKLTFERVLLSMILLIVTTGIFLKGSNPQIEMRIGKENARLDFCAMVMQQMIAKNVSDQVMLEGLYQKVREGGYENLRLEGGERLKEGWARDGSCLLLVKGKTLRSFELFLEEDAEHPFFYVVKKIREHELFQSEEV